MSKSLQRKLKSSSDFADRMTYNSTKKDRKAFVDILMIGNLVTEF